MLGPRLKCVFCTYSNEIKNHINQRLSIFLISKEKENPSLQYLLQIHALIFTSGNSNNPFIASKLISHYASLSKPNFFTPIFQSAHPKDTFLCNSLIKAHFSLGFRFQTLSLFLHLRACGFSPDHFVLPMLAIACADLSLLCSGKCIHALAFKLGIFPFVASSFVYMYCKFRQLVDARNAFEQVSVKNVTAWNALIVGYVQNNGESDKALECIREMYRASGDGERPNFRTLQYGFQACGSLGALVEGQWLHSLAIKTGVGFHEEVKSSILCMYSKCGTPVEAHFCFSEMKEKDLVSWMLLISVYSKYGHMFECVALFWEMRLCGVSPDDMVMSCVIWGFGNSMFVKEGKAFHGSIVKEVIVGEMVENALIVMYGKFGLLNLSEKLFNRMQRRSKEGFSSMILSYHKIGDFANCLKVFREMISHCIDADSDSFSAAISSCCQLGTTLLGSSLHCYAIKSCMDENVSAFNSLIDMYGKNGDMALAWRVFHNAAQKDIVTWNTMISCHNHNNEFSKAISLFDQMISEDVNPNSVTLVIMLSACSHLASLEKGESVHRRIKELGLEINLPLGTALVDMYAKCGKLDLSRNVFDSMKEKDLVSWNAMIGGYGAYGDAESAIELFKEMEKRNVKPNQVTFLSLLSACNHSGLVEEGELLFSKMKEDYHIEPNMKHYGCMVDLQGRSGKLKEAEAIALSMPGIPDGGIWGSLLSCCIKYGEMEMGERVARRAIESDPKNEGYYVTLSNIYTCSGRWAQAQNVRTMMKERGIDKQVAWSLF